MQQFPESPGMAEYVHTAADLVYDWRPPLKLAYEHILVDNIERFPPDVRQTTMRARQALDLAVAWALKRVRRNYKTVVPQWYPRLGAAGAQFLMPLDLSGDNDVDLALVVSAVGDSAYRGHTVLTLDMAYTNARLVARPDSDWLVPRATAIPAVDEAFDPDADAPGWGCDRGARSRARCLSRAPRRPELEGARELPQDMLFGDDMTPELRACERNSAPASPKRRRRSKAGTTVGPD